MHESDQPDLEKKLRQFERFEDRLAMSAQPLADAIANAAIAGTLPPLEHFQVTYNQDSLQAVRAQYDLNGSGQTIAVIDSGIAWDHYALGGGFGAGHKVVGGWDFAENDANPYDDGPAGFHGTHVSGIIGSSDATYRGVASGADLVGLRVFNDQGAGNMQWVEQALQWVHNHRNDFENPITTVNLSLGADWNSNQLPSWAILENEFAQLEQDGIFISVAAGNAFAKYNTTGLAYPAVSSHVVPVASHGADGTLSDFSQRDTRVLVAPGESIRSTAPDHLFTGGKTGQFLGASGTSMAAPYVAGASAVLREAYEFVGFSSVNQQTLYDRLLSSADRFFDQATSNWYNRVNLERALSQVIVDREGNTFELANDFGILKDGNTITGTIGTKSDADAFSFRPQETGLLTLDFSATHQLIPSVQVNGDQAQWNGDQLVMHVTAGQEYQFLVRTTDGIGHYEINADLQPIANAISLGTIIQNKFADMSVAQQQHFQLTAGRDGLLTILANVQSGQASFQLLDSQGREIGTSRVENGAVRLEAAVEEGATVFVRVNGSGTIGLSAANLVSLKDGKLEINGTLAQDSLQFNVNDKFEVRINDFHYAFQRSEVQSVDIYGHGGNDLLSLKLGQGNEQVRLGRGTASITSSTGWNLTANGVHSITAFAGAGQDQVSFFDSIGDDRLYNDRSMVAMQGAGFANYSVGFEQVLAVSSSGQDRLEWVGSSGDDYLEATDGFAELRTREQQLRATGFRSIQIAGGGGNDMAALRDSIGNDAFSFGPRSATAQIGTSQVQLSEVASIHAQASSGYDSARFLDSNGNDLFYRTHSAAGMIGSQFNNSASGFDFIQATSIAGVDIAQLTDSAGNDTAWMHFRNTILASNGQRTEVAGFSRVNFVANQGGQDVVYLVGTSGNDAIYSDATGTSVQNSGGALNRAVGVEQVNVDGWAGQDTALLQGSSQIERLSTSPGQVRLQRAIESLTLNRVGQVAFDGRGGADEVVFSELDQNDQLFGNRRTARASIDGQTIEAINFGVLEARAQSGETANYDLASVDYLFMLEGSWRKSN